MPFSLRASDPLNRIGLGWLISLILTVFLTGCGGQTESTHATSSEASTDTIDVRLTPASSDRARKDDGEENLLDLRNQWHTWNGTLTDVRFDADRNGLVLPGGKRSVAVQRFDLPLKAGMSYTLSVSSTSSQSMAALFPFDERGNALNLTAIDFGPIYVPRDQTRTFVMPVDAAGFFLQVQNFKFSSAPVHAPDSVIDAQFRAGDRTTGENLIDMSGSWPDWTGRPSGVRQVADSNALTVPVPPAGHRQTIAVRRYDTALIAGNEYELSVLDASDPQASVLLFLFDASGQPIVVDEAASGSWLTATLSQPTRFMVPANAATYAIQVQGSWDQSEVILIEPGLFDFNTIGMCTPTVTETTLIHQSFDGHYAPWGNVAMPADGQSAFFVDRGNNLIAGDPDAVINQSDVFRYDLNTGDLERITSGTGDEHIYGLTVSADGRYSAFSTQAGNLIAGDPDTNSVTEPYGTPEPDVFLFDRQLQQIERITPGTLGRGGTLPWSPDLIGIPAISHDGQVLIYNGGNRGRYLNDPLTCEGCDYVPFIVDRAADSLTRVLPSNANARAINSSITLSGDGNIVAFSSEASNLITGQQDANGAVADIFVFDRRTGMIERVTPGTQTVRAYKPTVSYDGRIVAFEAGSNYNPDDQFTPSRAAVDIFVTDRQTGKTTRITTGMPAGSFNRTPAISGDGKVVGFGSAPADAIGGAFSGKDVYVHHRPTNKRVRLTPPLSRYTPSDGFSSPVLSEDGRRVMYRGSALEVLGNDERGIFVANVTYPCP